MILSPVSKIDKLEKNKGQLAEEMAHIEEHNNTLFKKDGKHLRPGQASKSAFNAKMKAMIKGLLSCAEGAVKNWSPHCKGDRHSLQVRTVAHRASQNEKTVQEEGYEEEGPAEEEA